MDTATIVVIVLVAILVVFLSILSLLFFRFRSRSRHAGKQAPHMAARWDHMDSASRRRKAEAGFTDDDVVPAAAANAERDDRPDEFGMGGGIVSTRSSGGSSGGNSPGTGPNGTRSFLRGWFGLDEPTFAGYNNSASQREKDVNGDLLPMTGAAAQGHRPLRRDDEEEWEITSVPDARVSEGADTEPRPSEKP